MPNLRLDDRLDKYQIRFVSLGRQIEALEKDMLRDRSLLKHANREQLALAEKHFRRTQSELGKGIEALWKAIGRQATEPKKPEQKDFFA